jgi:hypothetical protein
MYMSSFNKMRNHPVSAGIHTMVSAYHIDYTHSGMGPVSYIHIASEVRRTNYMRLVPVGHLASWAN